MWGGARNVHGHVDVRGAHLLPEDDHIGLVSTSRTVVDAELDVVASLTAAVAEKITKKASWSA